MNALEQLQARNRETGGNWFAPDTMRFFDTRVSQRHYRNPSKPSYVWFVTSDRAPFNPRRYTVRLGNLETGEVSTVGHWSEYDSAYYAHKAASALASVGSVDHD